MMGPHLAAESRRDCRENREWASFLNRFGRVEGRGVEGRATSIGAPLKAKPMLAAVESFKEAELEMVPYDVKAHYKTAGCAQRISRSLYFEKFALGVIACHAVWIAIDTDFNTSPLLSDAHWVFQFAEYSFLAFFTFELFIRLFSFKRTQECLKDFWFAFDTCLVCIMIFDTLALNMMMATGALTGGTTDKSVRLMRLTQLSRLVRILRATPELVVLFKVMVAAMRSVGFTLLLLVCIIYSFAIFFTQIADGSNVGNVHFRTVSLSMYTLLLRGAYMGEIVTITDEIKEESPFLCFVFLFFVMLTAWIVVNMLIGLMSEIVSVIAESERWGMSLQFLQSRVHLVMEEGGFGTEEISRERFEHLLKNRDIAQLLKEVGVRAEDVFEMLDLIWDSDAVDETDCMSFNRCMDVALQMRGTNVATVKDLIAQRKCLNKIQDKLCRRLDDMETNIFCAIKFGRMEPGGKETEGDEYDDMGKCKAAVASGAFREQKLKMSSTISGVHRNHDLFWTAPCSKDLQERVQCKLRELEAGFAAGHKELHPETASVGAATDGYAQFGDDEPVADDDATSESVAHGDGDENDIENANCSRKTFRLDEGSLGDADDFFAGRAVKIIGLRNHADLNNQTGIVKEWDKQHARWNVVMGNGSAALLKPKNLRPLSTSDRSAMNEMQGSADLNGSDGLVEKIIKKDGEERLKLRKLKGSRKCVRTRKSVPVPEIFASEAARAADAPMLEPDLESPAPATPSTTNLATGEGVLVPGTRVAMSGLQGRSDLNGTEGIVDRIIDQDGERWIELRMLSGGRKRIRARKMVVVSEGVACPTRTQAIEAARALVVPAQPHNAMPADAPLLQPELEPSAPDTPSLVPGKDFAIPSHRSCEAVMQVNTSQTSASPEMFVCTPAHSTLSAMPTQAKDQLSSAHPEVFPIAIAPPRPSMIPKAFHVALAPEETALNANKFKEPHDVAHAKNSEPKNSREEEANRLRNGADEFSKEVASLKEQLDAARREAAESKRSGEEEMKRLRSETDLAYKKVVSLQEELDVVRRKAAGSTMSREEAKWRLNETDEAPMNVAILYEELDAARREAAELRRCGEEETMRLRSEAAAASNKAAKLQAELDTARREVVEAKRLRSEADETSKHAASLNEELDVARREAAESKKKKKPREEEATRLRSEADEASKKAANLKEELDAARREAAESKRLGEEEAKRLRVESLALSRNAANLKDELDVTRRAFAESQKSKEEEAKSLRSEADEASKRAAHLKEELDMARREVAESRNSRVEESKRLRSEADEASRHAAKLQEELDVARREVAELKKTGEEYTKRLRDETEGASKYAAALKYELDAARRELEEINKCGEEESTRLRKEAEAASKKAASSQEELKAARREVAELKKSGEEEAERLRSESMEASARLTILAEELEAARREVADVKMCGLEEAKRLGTEADEASKLAASLKEELDIARILSTSTVEEARRVRSDADEASKLAASLQVELDVARKDVTEAKTYGVEEAKRLRSEADEASKHVAALKEELDVARNEVEEVKKEKTVEVTRLRSEAAEALREVAFLKKELGAAANLKEEADAARRVCVELKKSREEEARRLRSEADDISSHAASLKEELDAARREVAELKKCSGVQEAKRLRSKANEASKIATYLTDELDAARREISESKKSTEEEAMRLRGEADVATRIATNLQAQLDAARREVAELKQSGKDKARRLRSETDEGSKHVANFKEGFDASFLGKQPICAKKALFCDEEQTRYYN